MFFWSTGFPPIVTFALFALGMVFLFFTFFSLFRGPASYECDLPVRRRTHRISDHGRWQCSGPVCQADNRGHARFCRMCGRRRPGQPV